MPRPRMNRWIRCKPKAQFYAPLGVPPGRLRGVTLSLDGLEALRLADAEGLDQEQAALSMGISRPTFSRLLAEAREIVAKGLVNGWALRIEGGNYEFVSETAACSRSRRGCRRGGGGGGGRRRHAAATPADDTGTSAPAAENNGFQAESAPGRDGGPEA